MLIQLDANLFNNPNHFRDLDQIFIFFENYQHDFVLEKEEDLDIISESKWLNNQGDFHGMLYCTMIEKAFTSSINITRKMKIDRGIVEINETNIKKMLLFIKSPLFILVENEVNDGYFLEALIRCFRKNGKKLRQAKTKNWIKIYNGGGKNMIGNLIDNYNKEDNPRRLFVLVDSDKLNPEFKDKDCENLKRKCQDYGFSYHIIHKRETENYLPIESLEEVPTELKPVLNAYKKLHPVQQDFYDLEKGFKGKSKPSEAQQQLFELKPDLHNALRNGFNSKAFLAKKEFPKFFQNEQKVTRVTLKNRCAHQPNPNELEEILEKITNLL